MKLRRIICLLLAMLLVSAPACAAKKRAKVKRYQNTCQTWYCRNCASQSACSQKPCLGGNCANACGTQTTKPSTNPSTPTTNPSTPTTNPSTKPNDNATVVADNSTSLANEVIRQTNQDRAKYGLGSLSISSALTKAACIRAAEIVKKFSHTRPDGSKWSTVSNQAYAENIAKGHNSPDRVMAAWMSSQGHRQNILRASYGSIGVCAYKVNNVIYWVQLFGK